MSAQNFPAQDSSFQYLETWDGATPFRWSNPTIVLSLPATYASYSLITLSMVGYEPQQSFSIALQHQQSQFFAYTTHEQRFRKYHVLFQRNPEWIPTLTTPQLIIQTQPKVIENRTLGLAVHHIHMQQLATRGVAFWWELAWVGFTLFVTSFAITGLWQSLRWLVSIVVCIGLAFAHQQGLAQMYIRIIELGIIIVFFDYQKFPALMRPWLNRTAEWFMFDKHTPHSLGHQLAQQWFVGVGISGIATGLLWWLRNNDNAEWWDLALFVLAIVITSITTLWATIRRTSPINSILSKRTYLGIVSVLVGWFVVLFFGFQNETLRANTIPRFAGFDVWFFMVLMGVSLLFPYIMQQSHTTRWGNWFMRIVAVWICFVAVATTFTANDAFHNMYVVNETLAPIAGRLAYHDFIPQYSSILAMWIWLIQLIPALQGSTEIVNIGVYGIMTTTLIVAGLMVITIYQSMERKSYAQAIIFALPPIFMSSFPAWNRIIESTPSADFYSIVPMRLFSIVALFFVSIHFLEKWKHTIRAYQHWYLGIISGIIIFNNNDFGFMSAFALGIIIVFNPYMTNWQTRFSFGLWYCAGIISFFLGIIAAYHIIDKPLNPEYIFWFSRQFSGGFGALMISFPGPGTLVITLTVALCVVAMLNIIRPAQYRDWLLADPIRIRNYRQFLYFTIVATIGLLYYLNRSSARSLGISLIPLSVALYSLWTLIRLHAPTQTSIVLSTIRSGALFPVALICGYTLIPTAFPPPLQYADVVMQQRQADIVASKSASDRMSDWPFETVQLTATKLQAANLHVGYYGPFPHIAQAFTRIPTTLMFNHPHDMIISPTTKRILCGNVFKGNIDVVIVADVSIVQKSFCNSYPLYQSPLFPSQVAFNPDISSQPTFTQLTEHLQLCRVDQESCQQPRE